MKHFATGTERPNIWEKFRFSTYETNASSWRSVRGCIYVIDRNIQQFRHEKFIRYLSAFMLHIQAKVYNYSTIKPVECQYAKLR